MSVNELILHLNKFSKRVIEFGNIIEDDRIEKFENIIGFTLPADFKYFSTKCNGVNLMGNIVLPFHGSKENVESLERVYQREHYEVENSMPLNLIPFSPDGGGNYYCFDLNTINEKSARVVFWQSDYWYGENDKPEVANETFLDFMNEVFIQWTLENWDYEGESKN